MTHLEVYQGINQVLKTLDLYAPIRLGGPDVGAQSIGIIPLPRSPGPRYRDGSRMVGLAFDVQCKSPSQGEALETCEKIADILDSQPDLIGCNTLEIYVEPHLAYRTDHEFVYSLVFYAEFLKG